MVVVSQCVRTAVGLRYVTTVSCYNFAFQCVLKRGSLSIPIKIFSEEHKIRWCTNTTFSINKLFYIVLSFYVLRLLLLLLSNLFKRHASPTQQYAGLQEGRVQRKITRSIKL